MKVFGPLPGIAINQNTNVLALHSANHADKLHLSDSVLKLDPLDGLSGQHVALMFFSPDCKHFSTTKSVPAGKGGDA